MKVFKIDHIGIAVEKIDMALSVWGATLGLPLNGIEEVLDQKVKTAFMPIGDTEIELLESTDPEGPIGKFIATKGQGVHHLAFRVENIDEALSELKAKGVRLIDEEPRYGAGGARIAFIHPKATGGVLVELCERT
ncbi:MAG: Glyoxalase/Bleomycin resistance protein/Dioxygenase superfamily protein [Spirochaetes bacterium ADurb.Bin110]|nr:MAG: Glyoxalase/Bleomycin resistance protein/Dioxygenase superfamily protein [Spirochaetes bacterium ADurb.Bin110]